VVEGARDSTRRKSLRDVRTFSLASFCEEYFLQRQRSSASGAPSTTVRSLRELQWSPSPAIAGAERGGVLTTRSALEFYPWRGGNAANLLRYPPLATCFSLPSSKEGRQNADRRRSNRRACARRALSGARTPVGVLHRGSHLREYLIPKARLQARLPGTRSARALPAFACPSPGSTSHPGHNAGRLIPKPPGSGLQIRPRAPHPLHLTACLRKASLVSGIFAFKTMRRRLSNTVAEAGNVRHCKSLKPRLCCRETSDRNGFDARRGRDRKSIRDRGKDSQKAIFA
jgi:hypothetical protein